MEMEIYGPCADNLPLILNDVLDRIKQLSSTQVANGHPKLYEHLIGRVKANNSMTENASAKATQQHRSQPCANVATRLAFA